MARKRAFRNVAICVSTIAATPKASLRLMPEEAAPRCPTVDFARPLPAMLPGFGGGRLSGGAADFPSAASSPPGSTPGGGGGGPEQSWHRHWGSAAPSAHSPLRQPPSNNNNNIRDAPHRKPVRATGRCVQSLRLRKVSFAGTSEHHTNLGGGGSRDAPGALLTANNSKPLAHMARKRVQRKLSGCWWPHEKARRGCDS